MAKHALWGNGRCGMKVEQGDFASEFVSCPLEFAAL